MQVTAELNDHEAITLRLASEGVTVYIPAGALDIEGYLVLTPREPNLFPDASLEPGWVRPRIVSVEIVSPDGEPLEEVNFLRPMEVCFLVSNAIWEAHAEDRSVLAVEMYDDLRNPALWIPLEKRARSGTQEICGLTTDLTLIALAVREPIPVPTQVEPDEL
jgi:hypothetical protein